ncbi:uncharacterized protein LOC129600181 isoform X2 [Paramacrobiotus metropolitanus]|nr:uncharacterized protein LOC129600181 isoform X2 [Paramacrobiotus metropolitanus]
MFFSKTVIDEKWQMVKDAYFGGQFPGIARVRVSTAMPRGAGYQDAKDDHAFAFHCGPAHDETAVLGIGQKLIAAFPPDSRMIYYKSDEQSEQQRSFTEKSGGESSGDKFQHTRSLYNLSVDSVDGPVTRSAERKSQHQNGFNGESHKKTSIKETHKVKESSPEANGNVRKNGVVMVLDTETTGFPPNSPPSDFLPWNRCRMVEIAWHLYTNKGKFVGKQQHIVKLDTSVYMPAEAIRVHGITREMSEQMGKPIGDILQYLENDLDNVSVVVGHNIQFDMKVILAEMFRANRTDLFQVFSEIPTACTMEMARSITPGGRKSKLAVVYEQCFGKAPSGVLHRADADVEICACVYFMLQDGIRILREDSGDGVNGDFKLPAVSGDGSAIPLTMGKNLERKTVFYWKIGLAAAVVGFVAVAYVLFC